MNGVDLRKTLALIALATLLPAAGWAAANGRPGGPPPEALNVCNGKNAGDAVQFTNRRGETVEATCRQLDDQLVALPDAPRGKRWEHGDNGERERGNRHMARMTQALNLTDTQQEQVRAIFAAEEEKAKPLRAQMAESREKLQQTIHSGTAEEATIRALAADQAALKTELLLLRADGWRQIHSLLTPEQHELAKTALPAAAGSRKSGSNCRD